MDVLVERCAGLDVHRDSVVATVRVPGRRRGTRRGETRTFATTIAGLTRMADWLVGEHAVTLVGMEATGVYWKPVFAVLEPEHTLECWLLNAQHMHNVPGRKTDVADSVWIAQLVEHGLVRPSFIPPHCEFSNSRTRRTGTGASTPRCSGPAMPARRSWCAPWCGSWAFNRASRGRGGTA